MNADSPLRILVDAGGNRIWARDHIPDNSSLEAWISAHWQESIAPTLLKGDFKEKTPPLVHEYDFWYRVSDTDERILDRAVPLQVQLPGRQQIRIRLKRRLLQSSIEIQYNSDAGPGHKPILLDTNRALGTQIEGAVATILSECTFRKIHPKGILRHLRRPRIYKSTDGTKLNCRLTPEQLNFGPTEILYLRPIEIGGWPLVRWEKWTLAVLLLVAVVGLSWWAAPKPTIRLQFQPQGFAHATIQLEDLARNSILYRDIKCDSTVPLGWRSGMRLIARVSPEASPLFCDTLEIAYGDRRRGHAEVRLGDKRSDDGSRMSLRILAEISGTGGHSDQHEVRLNGFSLPANGGNRPYYTCSGLRPGEYLITYTHRSSGEPLAIDWCNSVLPPSVAHSHGGWFDFGGARCDTAALVVLKLVFHPPANQERSEQKIGRIQ